MVALFTEVTLQSRLCVSHWQWGGCSSGLWPCWVVIQDEAISKSISQSWGRIHRAPPVNSPMSYMSNTDQTSRKESHVGTNADLLIRLGSWGECHCWPDRDGLLPGLEVLSSSWHYPGKALHLWPSRYSATDLVSFIISWANFHLKLQY